MTKRKELVGNSDRMHYDFIGKITTAGRDGVGLEFHWDGSKLGIKREDEETYTYSDLAYLESLTTKHIENALGYTPADNAQLTNLKLIVDGHTIDIDSIESNIDEMLKNISNLDELISLKADLEYVDIIFNKLDKELTVEITDLKRHLEELKSKVNKTSTKLDKYIEKFTNNMELKADITYVDDLINDVQDLLSEHNLKLDVIDGEISIIKENVDKKADKTYVDEQLNAKYDKSETYTREEVDERISKIVGNAPENLDTLEKLAEALDNDESFASTITKELSNKVDKEKGKGLSTNDFSNMYKLKLDGIEDGANKVTKVGQLENDRGYITLDEVPEVDLSDIESSISNIEKLLETKADKIEVREELDKLSEKIDNLDIPEDVDLKPVFDEIEYLKENKADKSYVENATQHIMNQLTQMIMLKADKSFVDKEIERLENLVNDIDVPEEVNLQPIYDEIEELKLLKSDKTTVQSEIDRLEKMIGELADGGEIDLSDYAKKKDIPKSLSQLTNDTGYITIADIPEVDLTDINKQLVDLQNNKANKSDVAEDINKLQQEIDNLDIPEEVDLKPIQDSLELLKENKADISYVQSEVDKLNESITNVVANISEDYALKDELPTKLSELNNDTNFITIEEVPKVDLSDIKNDIVNLKSKCETLQLDKADIVYVDDEITKVKAIIEGLDIPEEVDLQPIHDKIKELQTYVDNKLAQKVDKEQYISDIKELQETLSSHGLSITELNGEIVIVNSELDKKADVTYVDTKLNGYYKKSETYTRDEINSRIAEIIGNAPENLDTLEKLAKALDNDDSFASSVTKELSNKVDKESGKGLSSNDFTNTYKLKLDGIEKGANRVEKLSDLINDKGYITLDEVPKVDLTPYATKSEVENKLSDINIKDDEQDKKIQAIQDLIDVTAEGIFVDDSKTESSTAGSYNKGITISSVPKVNMPSIGSDSMLITVKTGLSKNAGQICIDESGLLYGRKANFFAVWGEWVSGEEVDLSQIELDIKDLQNNKASKSDIPTKLSQLENNEGFITLKDVPTIDGDTARSSTIVIANYDSHENSKENADIVINKGENASKKINEAIQSLKGTGGEVKLMEGNYNLEYGIAVNVDGVHLTGIPKATILVQNKAWKGNPFADNSEHVVDTWRGSNLESVSVEISNIYVKGANIFGSYGFNCYGSSKITNCISENSGSRGFYCTGSSKITNCTSENSGGDGFWCTGSSKITNCTSENSGSDGFYCSGSSKITNCISENSDSSGFNCHGSSTITNCISENSDSNGFNCFGSSKVTNCISENSGGRDFNCYDSSKITNCISENSDSSGFNCYDSSKITNCISENSGDDGFRCAFSFKGICSYNTLIGDKMNDNSSSPAIVQYNIIQEEG